MNQTRRVTRAFSIVSIRTRLWIASLILGSMSPLLATAQVEFTEVGTETGVNANTYESLTIHGLGVNWIDFDEDGWPDVFMVNGFNGDGAHLWRNEGNGTFSRADSLLPAMPNVEMMGSVFADYDNDGDSDIYIFTDNKDGPVGPFAGPVNILLQNQWVENGSQILPGQPLFIDVAATAGVEDLLDTPHADGPAYRSASGGWLDHDRDGDVDLYICHWNRGNEKDPSNKDRFYRNKGDGTFEDATDELGIALTAESHLPCLVVMGAHLDSDLWPDIYVSTVEFGRGFDNIYQNNAGAGFTDRVLDSPGVGDDSISGMGVTTADFDGNGGWDLYITDLYSGMAPLGNPLYMNQGTGILFHDNSSDVAGVQNNPSWGVNAFDIDHDGWEDLFVASMAGDANTVFINNQGDGTFTEHPSRLGLRAVTARGSAYADFDRDGDLDVLVSNLEGIPEFFRNDTLSAGHWLQIELVSNDEQTGNWSNRDAIGTLVKVTANGRTYMRQMIGGDSGHGQNALSLHFGLGDATTIDQVQVFWPSGAELILVDQPVDTFMAISEVGTSAAMVSPLPATVNLTETTTFDWVSDGDGAPVESWRLLVGTTPGASDYFDSGALESAARSAVVTGLPTDGSRLYVRLQYQLNGFMHHIEYQYGEGYVEPLPSEPGFASPEDGSEFSESNQLFSWSRALDSR